MWPTVRLTPKIFDSRQRILSFLIMLVKNYSYKSFPQFSMNFKNFKNTCHSDLSQVCRRMGPSLVCDVFFKINNR